LLKEHSSHTTTSGASITSSDPASTTSDPASTTSSDPAPAVVAHHLQEGSHHVEPYFPEGHDVGHTRCFVSAFGLNDEELEAQVCLVCWPD
jgi:hypothetical protein